MVENYKEQTVKELEVLCGERGIAVSSDDLKADIIARLEDADSKVPEHSPNANDETSGGDTTPAPPIDVQTARGKIIELHEAQLADRNVYTEPYLTGIANGLLIALAAVMGEDVDESKLLKPVTQVAVKGAKVLTGRQRLISEASKYISMAGGRGQLRSGLKPDEITEADEIMKRLSVEKGTYTIPVE